MPYQVSTSSNTFSLHTRNGFEFVELLSRDVSAATLTLTTTAANLINEDLDRSVGVLRTKQTETRGEEGDGVEEGEAERREEEPTELRKEEDIREEHKWRRAHRRDAARQDADAHFRQGVLQTTFAVSVGRATVALSQVDAVVDSQTDH